MKFEVDQPLRDRLNIEKGIEKGEKKKAIEIATNCLDILDNSVIAQATGLSIKQVETLREDRKIH